MAKYHFKEQDLQIRCVRWLRTEYPWLAKLLNHAKNEVASGNRTEGVIAKKEGVQAGMPDLMLHVASLQDIIDGEIQEESYLFHALAIELKTKTGRQSAEQKIIQRYFEAVGIMYVVVRTFEDFQKVVTTYVNGIPSETYNALMELWEQIDQEQIKAAREELKRLINKQINM